MKVLMVTPYFYPKTGGMEKYSYTISRGLHDKYKWEVVVVTSNHEENKYKEEVIDGIKIYRLPIMFKLSNTPINPLWFFSIKKIIKKEKPNVINAHSPVPFIADITSLVNQKIPFVLTYHSGSMSKSIFYIDILIKIYENLYLKRLFKNANKIIGVSKKSISEICSFEHKITIITPGVDIKLFNPAKNYTKNNILYVGKIDNSSNWKGLIDLINAFNILVRKNSKLTLNIVGEGNAIKEYENYVYKLNLEKNVLFHGLLNKQKLADEYRNNSMLVLPSNTSAESFGIVLIEAMATSIPVIGSQIGGIPDVIDDKINGLLFEPKNIDDLVNKIDTLLTNTNYALKLGLNGHKKVVKKYVWKNKIDEYNNLLYEISC